VFLSCIFPIHSTLPFPVFVVCYLPLEGFVMADLNSVASSNDQYPVFDGKRLHKRAFKGKGKLNKDHAALVAGVVASELTESQTKHLLLRMEKVKKVFKSRLEHHAQTLCVDTARSNGMKMRGGGGLVQTYSDILEALESNPRMESFQNWYDIYYGQFEEKKTGKKEAESKIMMELNVKYHDNTTSGGCVAELLGEVMSKLLENVQKRSREKQRLHLTKSRPANEKKEARRDTGDYFIIHTDPKGKERASYSFNVSFVGNSCGLCGREV
jgi:hypothetical protein